MEEIERSNGYTDSEKELIKICENSFLKPWCFPNIYKEDKNECCDLLVCFDNFIFIFFIKESSTLENVEEEEIDVKWQRWKRKFIEKQIDGCNGAERYILNKNKLFLDNKAQFEFPIRLNYETLEIFKFVITKGSRDFIKNLFIDNENGGYQVEYCDKNIDNVEIDPTIYLSKNEKINVLDLKSFENLLNIKNTFTDFIDYLHKKFKLVKYLDSIIYPSEEDLLAYIIREIPENFENYLKENKKFNYIIVSENFWFDLIKNQSYKQVQFEDSQNLFWDKMIEESAEYMMQSQLLDIENNRIDFKELINKKSAIYYMVKEPRVIRTTNSKLIKGAIDKFPEIKQEIVRFIRTMPSIEPTYCYIYLQVQVNSYSKSIEDKIFLRRKMLEIACGALKNKFVQFSKIIGISTDSLKYSPHSTFDYCVLECVNWSKDDANYYNEINKDFGFFTNEFYFKIEG